MKNPFEIIAYWISQQEMTYQEKRLIRERLVFYVTKHPVKTGIMSPYTFKFLSTAVASLVLIIGTSFGITQASMNALPYDKLYPVKLWIEEFQSNTKKDYFEKIAFENKRLETRFEEAATLAINQSLDESRAMLIQSGIERSQNTIKKMALSLEAEYPDKALDVHNNLEATLNSSSRVLARIESLTGQSVQPIVLAAQVGTEKISQERVALTAAIALQPTERIQNLVKKRFETLQHQSTDSDIIKEIQAKIDAELFTEALIIIQKTEQKNQEEMRTKKLEEVFDLPEETHEPKKEAPIQEKIGTPESETSQLPDLEKNESVLEKPINSIESISSSSLRS